MSKITEKDVELLKTKLKTLEKELESYDRELENFKVPKTRQTISDDFYKSRKSEKIIELNETNIKKIDNKERLKIYELLSGISVDEISSKYFPIKNQNGELVETNFMKFEVKASINQMKFYISYVTNQNLKDCYEDKVNIYKIKELDIIMMKKLHQNELSAVIKYFRENPSQFGLAMLCLKEYEHLFSIRNSIKKEISEENSDIVTTNMMLDENENAYLEIFVGTKNQEFFTINWSIAWVESLRTVIDQFDIEIHLEDPEFLESVKHNFDKLTNVKLAEIKVTDINNETMRKENENCYVLPKTEKLKLIKNAILAAKASM